VPPTDPNEPRRSRPSGQSSGSPTGQPRPSTPRSSTSRSPSAPSAPTVVGPALRVLGPDPRWRGGHPVATRATQGQEEAAPPPRARGAHPAGGHRPGGPVAGGGRGRLRLLPLRMEQGGVQSVPHLHRRSQRPALQRPTDRFRQPGRETAAEATQFGDVADASGQRSDTIKIVRVDPATGTASSLSIPRDTYVTCPTWPPAAGCPARQDQRRLRQRPGRVDREPSRTRRHPHQPLHRDQLLRPAGRGQRPRRHLHEIPLPGP